MWGLDDTEALVLGAVVLLTVELAPRSWECMRNARP